MKNVIIQEEDEPGIPTIEREEKSVMEALGEAFSKSQLAILNQPTPRQFIKQRPGAGGQSLSYVEVGYVVGLLNLLFGHFWDWEIVDEQIGKKQVWVKGKLTINSFADKDRKIVKSAYGSSAIKFNRTTGEPIDVGDDLKAASSDALKKASSLLGIAADVYWPNMDRLGGEDDL